MVSEVNQKFNRNPKSRCPLIKRSPKQKASRMSFPPLINLYNLRVVRQKTSGNHRRHKKLILIKETFKQKIDSKYNPHPLKPNKQKINHRLNRITIK